MKDNFTIIKEDYNTIEGTTIVVINTAIGSFEGKTEIDEIDVNYPSVFQGYEIALNKALRKFAKAALTIYKSELRTLKGIQRQFCNKPSETFSHEALLVFRAIEEKESAIKLWTARIFSLDNLIKSRIKARDNLVKKYIEKDKKD